MVEQKTTGNRPQCGAGAEAGGPDGNGQAPLVIIPEHGAHQGQRGRQQHGAEHGDPHPSGHQPPGSGRESGQGGDDAKTRGPDHEDFAPSDPVPQAAHGNQEGGQDQRIHVHDPQQLRRRGMQRPRNGGQREAESRVVHGHQEHRQHEDGQGAPLAGTSFLPLIDHGGHDEDLLGSLLPAGRRGFAKSTSSYCAGDAIEAQAINYYTD
nr:hypothetical protein [Kocuria sp. cx-116]